MGLIPEVKCRRCGSSFPAYRSTCPSCGSRRVAQSTRNPGTTAGTHSGTAAYERNQNNLKWQLIFGLILVAAIILAVIIMVSTGVDSGTSSSKKTPAPTATVEAQPTPESAPTPTPTPTPTVERIDICYYDTTKTEFTMKVGESLPLKAVVYPLTIQGVTPKWSVGDSEVLKLTHNDDGSVTVECLQNKAGGTKIYVECCGVKAECQVYTNGG